MSDRRRFWIETVLCALSLVFCLLTLVWKDWIEIVFGIDPDHHSGSVEWLIAAGALVLAIAFGLLARSERRRAEPAAAAR